jgi:hypothetical protein
MQATTMTREELTSHLIKNGSPIIKTRQAAKNSLELEDLAEEMGIGCDYQENDTFIVETK